MQGDDMDMPDTPPSRNGASPTSSPEPIQRRRIPPSPPRNLPERPKELHYRQKLILRGHRGGVSCVKFSPNGRWIASCSADATIKIWDALTGNHEHTLEGHLAGINTISWSPDSRILASGSDDKTIRLWHVSTGKPHPTPFLGHHNTIFSLAISPHGNILVSGSYDEAVFLWDIRSAHPMRSLPAHSDPVGGVDFIRDGTLIVSCSSDGLIRIWDTATGQCLRTIVHEDNPAVTSVRFSPNGKFICAWTLDGAIRLWEYGVGRCVKTYQGHVNKKYSLSGAFGTYSAMSSPPEVRREEDDAMDTEVEGLENVTPIARQSSPSTHKYAFIASGSEDGAIVLWDVSSKEILQRAEGHDGVVLAVDTHPTEPWIVSGGIDRTVRVWRLESSPPGGSEKGKEDIVEKHDVDMVDGIKMEE
ncbi:WD40 repeat-like protein [Aulographum hederae CBS 113979]|uniref:Mitochondrial division protein 1 n=1 Tax=Aulographum hederae CBS 113979 TaxID=1176131 RepID=A0A6G1GRH2_9PEZI|nr:WD40 repeat-like protein [Aulographum hederae CBS 113979]